VCSDEGVAEALANGLPKAHILVFEMSPMSGFRLCEILADGPNGTASVDAFALTSYWQISRDLVEWLACESPPLSSETRFSDFERKDGYVSLKLGIAPSDAFFTDFAFVNYIEHKAE
jgi:hypothetical protein